MVLPFAPCLAEQGGNAADTSVSATMVKEKAEAEALPKPRIKYRNGPVCMCNTGMSEAEIQAGQKNALRNNTPH
jgi:hypothetical protein